MTQDRPSTPRDDLGTAGGPAAETVAAAAALLDAFTGRVERRIVAHLMDHYESRADAARDHDTVAAASEARAHLAGAHALVAFAEDAAVPLRDFSRLDRIARRKLRGVLTKALARERELDRREEERRRTGGRPPFSWEDMRLPDRARSIRLALMVLDTAPQPEEF